MCGIAGALQPGRTDDGWRDPLQRMGETLRHRGPDDQGTWFDAGAGVGLSHRRLSILDLSPEGHQPMLSASGRFVVVYNGEIYNFAELRAELDPAEARWRGHSDTEVLLAAIEAWGIDRTVSRLVGMFAFGLWDRRERRLTLVRDRLGIKPLYYAVRPGLFLFGSELKALEAHPDFRAEIDRDSLVELMKYGYIPAPHSIYSGVRKLEPGSILDVAPGATSDSIRPRRYWSVEDVALRGESRPFHGDEHEAEERLHDLLAEAVGGRMVSDVPLGAFLSGGIDSSVVVALMQTRSAEPIKTFTIGFHERAYDEAGHARAVAEHLGTDHTELILTAADAMAVIPDLAGIWDEPFADSSQIPTLLVSRLARRRVTVSLSGDGGDELFAGYQRYRTTREIWSRFGAIPRPLRHLGAGMLRSTPPALLDATMGWLAPWIRRHGSPGPVSDKLKKLADVLTMPRRERLYDRLISHWKHPAELVPGGRPRPTELDDPAYAGRLRDFDHRMMLFDARRYLPDDILVKVDRASMHVSLEARVPLLDHRVVEFAWSLPPAFKARGGQGKRILRRVLDRYVPRTLFERPKMGFGVPVGEWLRGELRPWAEALLDERRLRDEGLLRPEPIRETWRQHVSGEREWAYYLWDVLMFQAWYERHRAAAGTEA